MAPGQVPRQRPGRTARQDPADSTTAFLDAGTKESVHDAVVVAFGQGLQQPGDFEHDLGRRLGHPQPGPKPEP
jgi:hypothetical protein